MFPASLFAFSLVIGIELHAVLAATEPRSENKNPNNFNEQKLHASLRMNEDNCSEWWPLQAEIQFISRIKRTDSSYHWKFVHQRASVFAHL
jgi:hypothetical protein